MSELLLIHPPVAIPTEPPIGISTLAARLEALGVRTGQIDAGIEALSFLLERADPTRAHTLAQRRAIEGLSRTLGDLRSPAGYADRERYRRAVADLGKVLALEGLLVEPPVRLGLANYQEETRSPLSSEDLRQAARPGPPGVFSPYFLELAERIAADPPRVIGLSINYLHQALPALNLAGVLSRRLGGKVPILAGGGLVRCWQGRLSPTALQPAVDRLVFDEGLPLLLSLLEHGTLPEEGCGSSCAEAPLVPPTAPLLGGMPWDRYLAPVRTAPLVTSLGCVWGRCRYCPEALSMKGLVAQVAPERLLPELIEPVLASSGAGLLHLADSTVPPGLLAVLAERPLPVPWYGFTRFDARLTDPEFCRKLKRSGCVMLQLGLESGSPAVLSHLRKGISLKQASAALQALSAAGIAVYLYIMLGIPGEREEDARLTLSFLAEHADCIDCLNTSLLNLPVGSPPEPGLVCSPLPGENCDLTLYSAFEQEGSWDRRAARRFLERELARHPRIAPILHRTPPVFGPNHAPFFAFR